MLFLLCLELVLLLAGYGHPTSFFLQREIGGRNVLIENERFGWRFFGPARARTPRPMEISIIKAADTCRIFVFGESAAYGDPKPEYGLPRFLAVLLRARFPGADFEVINAAMTGINSHVLLPIARDCAPQHGDVWVIYMGNNEVVGPFGSGTVFGRQAPSLGLIRANVFLKGTRTGQWLNQLFEPNENRSTSEAEWEGMAMFLNHQVAHDDPRMQRVYSHFQRNLEDMVRLGLAHGASIVLSTVVSDLKDCAPFASEHRSDLNPAQRIRWQELYNLGVQAFRAGQTAQALESFRSASLIDDQYAELQFIWGQCCLRLGQDRDAREHFILARDYDTLRFRADTRLSQITRAVAAGHPGQGVYLADPESELARESPSGSPGRELLHEHVHLNFDGNYALAVSIGNQISRALPGFARNSEIPGKKWISKAECARRLAWTGWDRYRAAQSVIWRYQEPPFTTQFDHSATCERLRQELEALLPERKPVGLRRAADTYREAIALAPNDWVLRRNFVELLTQLNDFQGAEAAARKAIELLPHAWLGHLQLGLLLLQERRPQEAQGQFEQVLLVDPQSVPAMNGLALAQQQSGRSQAAIAQLEDALKLKPRSATTHLNLASVFESTGREAEARQQIRLALEDKLEEPGVAVRLGKACMVQGWVDQAITNFVKALNRNPTDAAVQLYLGGALATKSLHDEAQQHLAEAVRLDPELAGGHLGLGIELGCQGKHAEAEQEFQSALRLNPGLIDARLRLGISLLHRHKAAEARAQFEQVLAQQPSNAVAQKYLATIDKL